MIRALLNHSIVYGFTHAAARGTLLISLLVLPAILTPADYGALAMLTLAANLGALIVPLQISQGLARHYGAAATEEEKRAYASSAWWFTLAAQLLFLLFGLVVAGWGTEQLLGDAGYRPIFRVALLVMVLNSLFFFVQSQFRWAFRRGEFVAVTLVYSVLTLLLSLGFALTWTDPLRGVIVGQASGGAVAVAWGAWRLRRTIFGRFNAALTRQLLAFSLPLVPAALSVSLMLYANRIVLNDIGGLEDVAVLSLASQIAAVAGLAIVGVQAALTPIITAHHSEPGTATALGRVFGAFCAGAALICLALGLFAPEAVALLGRPAYAAAAPLVLLLAPALLLAEMYIFAPGFWIAKRTRLQAAVSVGGAVVAFVAGYLLIGAFGLLGAAVSTLTATLLFFATWWVLSGRFYPVPVRWARLALFLLCAGTAGAAGLLLIGPGTAAGVAAKLALLALTAALAVLTGLVPWRDGVLALAALVRRNPPSSPVP